MPGLAVARGDEADVGADLEAALGETQFFDDYRTQAAVESEGLLVGRTEYEGYPIRRVETEHGTALLEGCLYDVADVDAAIRRVARLVAEDDRAGLREWIASRDGVFLLVLAHGDAVAVVNDALGRLPTYLATVDGTRLCSREPAFVRAFARRREEPLALDRLAAAQYCCFGYPLGTRTPFEGVSTVPPGSLVRLDGEASVASLHDLDLGERPHADERLATNGRALAEEIVAACGRRQFPGRANVLSLSGGLDSRVVGAAYRAAGLEADAATYYRSEGASDDLGAAGAVSDRLGLDWTTHRVDLTDERRTTLLELTQGTNYLGMGFLLEFLEQVRERYDAPVTVTGLLGEKVLGDLTPAGDLDSREELVEYVLGANSRLSAADAAAVAGVDEGRLRDSVRRRVDGYPETHLADRYAHFVLRERGINFVAQGEDRNRHFAWSVAPLFSLPVVRYATGCPPEQKRLCRLHVAILDELAPELLEVAYPNFGAPVTSWRYRTKQGLYDALERYPAVRGRLVDLVTGDSPGADAVATAIRAQLPALADSPLSARAVASATRRGAGYSVADLEFLYTVTSLAEDLQGDRPERARDARRGRPGSAAGGSGSEPVRSDAAEADRTHPSGGPGTNPSGAAPDRQRADRPDGPTRGGPETSDRTSTDP